MQHSSKTVAVLLATATLASGLSAPAFAAGTDADAPGADSSQTTTDARARLDAALKTAREKAARTDVYRADGLDALNEIVAEAERLGQDADDDALTTMADRLDGAVAALRCVWYEFDGQRLEERDGRLGAPDGYVYGARGGENTVITGADGSTVRLTGDESAETYVCPKPGVRTVSGVLTGEVGGMEASIPYRFDEGDEVTLADGTAFAADEDAPDSFTARMAVALDASNTPAVTQVTLSDGTALDVTWDEAELVRADDATRMWSADGVAEGTVGQARVRVLLTATRAWDPSLTVSVHRRAADGTEEDLPLDGLDVKDVAELADGGEHGLTLDHAKAGDAYRLTFKTGNASDVKAEATASLGADGTRVWNVAVHAVGEDGGDLTRTFTVSLSFDKAKPTVGDDKAALKGLTVNGRPIEGWDPDVLDYTIRAGGDEKVKVSPQAGDGQTVVASDARQTAYTTVQSWTVTCGDQSRTYTVTLVRDHDEPTADEAFEPSDATDVGGADEADSPSSTTLKSVGYLLDGDYHAVDADAFDVPEGGSFAYESYAGQIVKASAARLKGMTWRYSLGVLAADHETYGERSYDVTYVTAATSKAELTGVKVDGKAIDGFDPDVTDYKVRVNDPDKYVVTADWDKASGMSLTNHKDGRTVTLTALSADGRNSRTYVIEVSARPRLAATGAARLTAVPLALFAVLAGLAGLARIKRHVEM